MGYDSLHNLIENERAEKQSGMYVKDAVDEFDLSLACRRFPSIILSSSPRVELYDGTTSFTERMLLETQSCEGFLSDTMGEVQVRDYLYEIWNSLYPACTSVKIPH